MKELVDSKKKYWWFTDTGNTAQAVSSDRSWRSARQEGLHNRCWEISSILNASLVLRIQGGLPKRTSHSKNSEKEERDRGREREGLWALRPEAFQGCLLLGGGQWDGLRVWC